jgi:hypothetical protein
VGIVARNGSRSCAESRQFVAFKEKEKGKKKKGNKKEIHIYLYTDILYILYTDCSFLFGISSIPIEVQLLSFSLCF